MTDLVKQLRNAAQQATRGLLPDTIGGKPEHYLTGQAADEIERLRELIRQNCNQDIVALANGQSMPAKEGE